MSETRGTYSTQELAEIRARLEAATPGKWRNTYPKGKETRTINGGGHICICDPNENWRNDARFIAHAPEDIRYLLAEIETTRAALAIAREHIKELEAQVQHD